MAANARPAADWEQAARRADLTDAQINRMRAEMPSTARVQDVSAQATWWSFAGVAVSLLSAISGALASA